MTKQEIDEQRMTPDLLQRIAKCAPDWMGAEYEVGDLNTDSPPLVLFLEGSTNPHPNCRPLRVAGCERELTGANEQDDAAACFLMLDAMEKVGYTTKISNQTILVSPETIADGYRMSALQQVDADQEGNHYECYGPTRAIAIGEAFCKVFERG